MAGADLFLEPLAGLIAAVAEQNDAGLNLPHEIEQLLAVGVRGQIEIIQLAVQRDLACAGAQLERLATPRRAQLAALGFRVGVADQENRLPFVSDHPSGEVVSGGVFVHHPGGDDEDPAAAEPHLVNLPLIEDDEVQRLVELEIAVLAMGAMRFRS